MTSLPPAPGFPRIRRSLSAVLIAAVSVACATFVLTGCGDSASDDSTNSEASGTAFPITVGQVTLEEQPENIVSLSPTTTEMLFAIGAGPQVTAVDDQSDYPTTAPKSSLSGYQPNAEAIAAKNPDLVVLSSDINDIVGQLETLQIPTYLAPAAQTLDDTYNQMLDLGKLTGHSTEAEDSVSTVKTDIAEIVASVTPRSTKLTYFHELDPSLYTATSTTFIGSIYALLGLENIADSSDTAQTGGYPQLSTEALISANPDVIFLADTISCQETAATVAARAGYDDLTAVTRSQIVELDDNIASRWGPRVVDFLRAAANAVAAIPAE